MARDGDLLVSLALVRVKETLTKAEALWRYFEKLIIFDEVDALLETKVSKRSQLNCSVA